MNEQHMIRLFAELGEMRGDIRSVKSTCDEIKADISSHNDRINTLEHFKTKFLGVIAVVSLLATVGWEVVSGWVWRGRG